MPYPLCDRDEYQKAHDDLRELRSALNELSISNIMRGIDNSPIIEAREFVNNEIEYLHAEPDVYLDDIHNHLSPLARLLCAILYRDMVQS